MNQEMVRTTDAHYDDTYINAALLPGIWLSRHYRMTATLAKLYFSIQENDSFTIISYPVPYVKIENSSAYL
jgi:hypothetical protein